MSIVSTRCLRPYPVGCSVGRRARVHAIVQTEESLTDMGVASVDILYLHAPDLDTPVERTLEGGWRGVV